MTTRIGRKSCQQKKLRTGTSKTRHTQNTTDCTPRSCQTESVRNVDDGLFSHDEIIPEFSKIVAALSAVETDRAINAGPGKSNKLAVSSNIPPSPLRLHRLAQAVGEGGPYTRHRATFPLHLPWLPSHGCLLNLQYNINVNIVRGGGRVTCGRMALLPFMKPAPHDIFTLVCCGDSFAVN